MSDTPETDAVDTNGNIGIHPDTLERKGREERDQLWKICDDLAKCASQLGFTSSDDPKWIRRSKEAIDAYQKFYYDNK